MIYDVIDVAQDRHIPGMILLINFEKAFDSISWKFIYNTLHYFNFGPDLIKWVSVLYNRAKLCVIQNGIFSGIKIGKEKVWLLQYADDAVLFLDGSEKMFKKCS